MCISFIKILCVPGKMLVKLFYFNVHATGLYPQARKKKIYRPLVPSVFFSKLQLLEKNSIDKLVETTRIK